MTASRLDRLDEARRRRPGAREVERVLSSLRRERFGRAGDLVRLHDAVLFLRAYPHSRRVVELSDEILSGFGRRVAAVTASGGDLSPFDHPEVSGIALTTITTDYSFDVVRWLKSRFGRGVTIDWELLEATDRLRALWPKFLPLLEEEAAEDANVRYLDYLQAARPKEDLAWLLERIDRMPLPATEKAERYEAQGLSVRWEVGDTKHTRTRMRWPARKIFLHDDPLLRHGVSIQAELASSRLKVERLSPREGARILEMTRKATALRYREYYGFTYGDPASVVATDAGRGLEIFLMGLERSRRLPLRAGFAGFFVKNGVPVGYIEALAFFERVEVGFNIYYAFREGESAWIFARVVKALNQVLGSACFSMDPYQLGHENEEAIESGAFWFYRKIGFRSTDAALRDLTAREEEKIAADPFHRSSKGILRRLASHNLLYEIGGPSRSWDRFHIRNFSLAVIRRMAREFGGDAEKIRAASERSVARSLDLRPARMDPFEQRAFSDLALVLDLIPDLARWPRAERDAVAEIVLTKGSRFESRYLERMQKHARLRSALLKLGSSSPSRA